MSVNRRNKKDELVAAAVRLVAEGGAQAATVRAIAREAGVTDAALYRHYRSKDDLCGQAHKFIIEEMVGEKRHLVASKAPIRERLGEWVHLTYAYYDHRPSAFNYILAAPHLARGKGGLSATSQGELFLQMIRPAMDRGEMRSMPPELALGIFAGVLLNVPRLINEGILSGPASAYVDEVSAAAWRMLEPEVA